MATAVPGFNAADFRTNIRLAMTLGLPPVEDDQPTFVFPRTVAEVNGPVDQDGVGFDQDAHVTTWTQQASVKVPCAVEYSDARGRVENVGIIQTPILTLTLLDEDYVQVRGFEYVLVGGNRYFYRKTEAPLGLDIVGVWTIHCRAEDEV